MITTTNKPSAFQIGVAAADNDNNGLPEKTEQNAVIFVPDHIQPSMDALLDYYTNTAQKPVVKLCGGPLDIVSDFITQIESTISADLLNETRDVMDFMISNICDFCRDKSVSYMTFHFEFNRSDRKGI